MKRNFILLALGLFLTLNLSGQQKSNRPDRKNQSIIPFQESLPFGFLNQNEADKISPAWKSIASYKQKMDSFQVKTYNIGSEVWETLEIDRFTYDSNGRLILNIFFTTDYYYGKFLWYKDTASFYADGKPTLKARYGRDLETEPWKLVNKTETFYDALGKDTMSLYNGPDLLTGEWVTTKQVNTWDAGLLTFSVSWLLNETLGDWEKTGKKELTYDAAGNELSSSGYDWSDATNDWVPTARSESSYSADSRLTSEIRYSYSDADQKWKGESRREIAYDSRGNEILNVNFEWNSDTNEWNPQDKITRAFNSKDLLLEDVYLNWNRAASQWTPDSMCVYSYGSYGYDTLNVCSVYDPAAGIWNDTYRLEMEFDEYGNILHSLVLSSKDSTGEWTSRFKADYRFDLAFDQDEIALPFEWVGKEPANMYLGVISLEWNHSSRKWVESYSIDYYYSAFTGGSGDPETCLSSVHVYPNPVSDAIIIETDSSAEPVLFEMTDISGKQVISKTLNGNRNQVSVSELTGGLYLYRIILNGESLQGKVVKM